jgi:glycosyltransferase involved in cell wall biosynthesis
MINKAYISVVVPSYRCAGCIEELYRRLVPVLSEISPDFEIILVDDGSPDDDWNVISKLCRNDPRVRGVQLSRNYGQHYAITAGLDQVRGDWVVVMDCDLQDQPEDIKILHSRAMEGYDIVFARRVSRGDSLYRRVVSKFFILVYNWLGDTDFDNSVANFSLCSFRVIRSITQVRERNRSFPKMLLEIGFRRASVDIVRAARFEGESSYNLAKLLDLAAQCIMSRSNKPLMLSIRFGFLLASFSVVFGMFVLFNYAFNKISIPGWTTLAILISFLGGLGFANLGILGLYLGKVFDEVKERPLYFIRASLNTTLSENGKVACCCEPLSNSSIGCENRNPPS